jgi:hypothetical protein
MLEEKIDREDVIQGVQRSNRSAPSTCSSPESELMWHEKEDQAVQDGRLKRKCSVNKPHQFLMNVFHSIRPRTRRTHTSLHSCRFAARTALS